MITFLTVLCIGLGMGLCVAMISRGSWKDSAANHEKARFWWKARAEENLAELARVNPLAISQKDQQIESLKAEVRSWIGTMNQKDEEIANISSSLDTSQRERGKALAELLEVSKKLAEYREWAPKLCKGIVELDALLDHGPR